MRDYSRPCRSATHVRHKGAGEPFLTRLSQLEAFDLEKSFVFSKRTAKVCTTF